MKKILLICSHMHSGCDVIYESLNRTKKTQGFNYSEKNYYQSPLNFLSLTHENHKLHDSSALYMDVLNFNQQLSTKTAYEYCKFIYFIRELEYVLNSLIKKDKMNFSFAKRYYCFRLRRLYEMAKKTPGAIFLTWDDIKGKKKLELVENYLNIKEKINLDNSLISKFSEDIDGSIPYSDLIKVENTYEKYLFFLKNLNLQY